MEIRVTDVNARDEITIRTQFSDYRFRVTDPIQCRGIFSGGPPGEQQHAAFFAGEILPASRQPSASTRLETGGRAVFLIAGECFNKLTTSVIIEITFSETPRN